MGTAIAALGQSVKLHTDMTQEQAKLRATELATKLNWPWDANALEVRSWRVWPFSRVWRIISRVPKDNAVAMMRINDRTRKMVFGRVRYEPTEDSTNKIAGYPALPRSPRVGAMSFDC